MTEQKQSDTNPDQQETPEINDTETQTDTTPEKQALEIFELGRTYADQGEYQQAIDQFSKYITTNFEEKAAYANLGYCYLELEQYENAEKYCHEALKIDSDYPYALDNLGLVYSNQKNYNKACEYFLKCIEIDPKYKRAYANLANCYRELEQYEQAENYYNKAFEINPKDTSIIYNLGLVFFGQKKYNKARAHFLQYDKVDPGDKETNVKLGDCYRKLEQYENAENYYRKALRIDSDYTFALNNLGLLYSDQEKYSEACEQSLKCIEIDPEYKWAYANLVYCYRELKQYENVEKYSNKALEIDPEYTFALDTLGLVYSDQKKYDKAIAQFLKCIDIDPEDQIAISNWRWCLQFLDKTALKEEQEKFILWMRSHPSTDTNTELGHYFKWQLKDDISSIDYYQLALSHASNDKQKIACLFNLGNAYRDAGEIDKSIDFFKKASRDDNYSAEWSFGSSLHNLASLRESIGDYTEAQKNWAELIELYKSLLSDKNRGKENLYAALYCSMIQMEFEHQYDNALENCKIALSISPDELDALVQKNKILHQIREKAIDPVTINQYQTHQNIRRFESLIDKGGIGEDAYLSLFEMYFLEEEYDKAKDILQQILGLFTLDYRYYYFNGQLLRRQKRYSRAIKSFKTALSYDPNNFEIQNSLAGSYADSKNYNEAEKTYLKLLKQDNKNIDALIGLGENYLSISELQQQDSDYLDLAKKQLERALQLGTKGIASKRLNIHSTPGIARKFKDIQLSHLHYSLGYIDIKLYEINSIKNNRNLLKEAQDHFAIACESDPDNQKAVRALAKLEPLVEKNRAEKLDTLGAGLVISTAALVLFIVTYVFFDAYTKQAEQRYSLGQSISLLKTIPNLDDQQYKKLSTIKDVKFTDMSGLMNALQSIVGTNAFQATKQNLDQVDLQIITATAEPRISVASFAMIAFSCIAFIIMGLFMPSLLRVKIGVIELEKNASIQGQMPTSIGLSR